MGVLHMAIPSVGGFPRQARATRHATFGASVRSRVKAAVSEPEGLRAAKVPERARPAAASGTLLPLANLAPRVSAGTVLRPGREGIVQRTAEQEVAQEAVVKLVRLCMAGDQQAWQQLVVSQHRRIYGICFRFTGSATDAEDLTQDVFLKVYRNLASFDTERGSFQTWIATLARNLLVDHFRRTRLERATDSLDASVSSEEDGATMADRLADPRPSQEAHASGLELKARIQHALAQLSPELREAVVFRDLEDMDYKDIAQVLKIPEGTVKSRISRGRGELARLLQRTEGQVV